MITILNHLKNLKKLCTNIIQTREILYTSGTAKAQQTHFETKIPEYEDVFKYNRNDLFSKVFSFCNNLTEEEFWVIILRKILDTNITDNETILHSFKDLTKNNEKN